MEVIEVSYPKNNDTEMSAIQEKLTQAILCIGKNRRYPVYRQGIYAEPGTDVGGKQELGIISQML